MKFLPNYALDIQALFYEGIVLVTGCFDIIHAGHVALIEHAATLGTVFVGINSDAAVASLKGPTRPINSETDRCTVAGALQNVRHVFIIDSDKVDETIRLVKPSYWVKGGDYTLDTLDKAEVAAAMEVGAVIVLFPKHGAHSTTRIIEQLG